MKARLTITDLTRMQGDRVCIGGCLDDGTCVRPVFRLGGLQEEWLYARGQVIIQPFAVVEFDFREKTAHPPHTEDRIIDRVYRVRRCLLGPLERHALLLRIVDPSVEAIFGASIYREPGWYVRAGEGCRSLGTVKPGAIHGVDVRGTAAGGCRCHIAFTDAIGQEYHLKVTDLAFQYFLRHLLNAEQNSPEEAAGRILALLLNAETLFRIGLARGWERYPDRCYVQLTGIYSFPDYLEGRCFADFAADNSAPGYGSASVL